MSWNRRKKILLTARLNRQSKEHAVKQDADGEWFSLRYATRYMGVTKCTLLRWKRRCAVLGRGVQTRKFDGGRGLEDYISKADLDTIATKRKALPTDPEQDTTCGLAEALAITGLCRTTLEKYLPSVRVQGRRKDGRPCQKIRFDRLAVEEIAQRRVSGIMRPTEIAEYLDIDQSTVHSLFESGELAPLPDEHVKIGEAGRGGKQALRSEVEELARKRAGGQPASIVDGKTYLPYVEAGRRYPNATQKILIRYANKSCPYLGGRILHVRPFPVVGGMGKKSGDRYSTILKWLEDDLRNLATPLIGMPAQTLAKAIRKAQQTNPPNAGERGRKASELTWEVYRFCYEHYITKGKKGRVVLSLAQTLYGANAPKEDSAVAQYARRYARKHRLSLNRIIK